MRSYRLIPLLLVASVLSIALTGCQLIGHTMPDLPSGPISVDHDATPEQAAEGLPIELIRVVDGDTIAVVPTTELPATNDAGTEHVVRLLSIDAPEMNKMGPEEPQCGAQEATDRLASLMNANDSVTLSFDSRSDHTDRYGRSLAYVQTLDGVDIALEMVRAGYAEAWYPSGEPEPERFASYWQTQVEAHSVGAGAFGVCENVGR